MRKLILVVVILLAMAGMAPAATLSWNAVTTYTDGTTIPGSKTITYNAKSGSTATGPWSSEGTSTTTSKVVSEPAPGATKYYTVSATVDSVESANPTAVSKSAPYLTPNPPTGLTIN